MSTFERSRTGSALALKLQSTDDVDAIDGTPAAGDWVDASFDPRVLVQQVQDTSYTGSLDGAPPIVGGASIAVPIRMMLRGAGAAGAEPEIARLLLAASLKPTATAAAVGAPTAATAGTTTTATLADPFAATADLYAGMPITLSGEPVVPRTTMVTDYSVGRVATLGRTFDPTLDTDTLAQIPINNRYALSDLETDWQRLTAYFYFAGQLMKTINCHLSNPVIELAAGQPAMLSGTLIGVLVANPAEQAMPAGAATAAALRLPPPIWIAGEAQLGRSILRCATLSIGLGTAVALPENPENANGFDSAQITGRAVSASLVAYANSTNSPTRFAAYRAGGRTNLSCILGSTAGNRFGIALPLLAIADNQPGDRNGLGVDNLTLVNAKPGAGFFLASF
ncbi:MULTISPECIES: phage tail tube protein [Roseomonadaceae]|uniref:Uncharacterized protein n=1 Tax=Falsiroseomonas oleicola TaxID=2801474 RepID=A0ABS6H5N3_9PROT|nr:phage tail tube protein [Roseomonas oleicola]MBU8543994.1 hypothetical protein [Roseomonas oleicola]